MVRNLQPSAVRNDARTCNFVSRYHCFEETFCLHVGVDDDDDGGGGYGGMYFSETSLHFRNLYINILECLSYCYNIFIFK